MELLRTLSVTLAVAGALSVLNAVDAHAGSYDDTSRSHCAVSETNGKVEGAAGVAKAGAFGATDGAFQIGASLSAPLGCNWGVQFDAAGLRVDNANAGGGAAHIFTRDPSRYLLGVTGGIAGGEGLPSSYFGGAEGELYLGRWTLSGGGGVAHVSSVGTRGYGQAGISLYPTDDFRLSLSGAYAFKNFLGGARAEWQPSGSPVSFYLEGKQSDHSFSQGMFGIRLYLGGESKSLIRRNREDDPEPMLYDFTTQAYVTHERFATINGLPLVHNGTCPPGYFYDPTLSLTVCFR